MSIINFKIAKSIESEKVCYVHSTKDLIAILKKKIIYRLSTEKNKEKELIFINKIRKNYIKIQSRRAFERSMNKSGSEIISMYADGKEYIVSRVTDRDRRFKRSKDLLEFNESLSWFS
ncbi:hypothetical protein [Erysipelothrix aquatica]|uniref:hypothetical protein n=1 Tax=Erysipelothrix aquatica TaxID=2683714 RepID=UPI00135A891E|nr:hypothetical protein [Erysipelothrix aquatica]